MFWRNYYANRDKALIFPADNKEEGRSGYGQVVAIIRQDKLNFLHEQAQKFSITIFQMIMGIWVKILNEYIAKQDIIIGAFFPGRKKNCNDMIGLFTTCLGLRLCVGTATSLEDIFREVKKNCIQLNKYQDTNLREVFGYMQLKDLAKGELFKIVLNYHSNLDFTTLIIDKKIEVNTCDLSCEANSHPVNVSVYEFSNQLKTVVSYDKAQYSDEYMESIVLRFKQLIGDVLCRLS